MSFSVDRRGRRAAKRVRRRPSPQPPPSACLHELFEAQAARRPEAVAAQLGDEILRYRELNRRANQVARHLRSLGVRPETLVGLCFERSLEMIVALLGVLKAGGAYVPLDPDYPRDRLAFLLEDSDVPVVLTVEKQAEIFSDSEARCVLLDADAGAIDRRPDHDLRHVTVPENLAYLIYTSGSTGSPKGVLVEHRNVARLFAATHARFRFDERDVWTLFHSYDFDFSVWEIWGALLYGGRLVVVPYWVSRSPDAFHGLLREERVTVLNQTPSAFRQVIAADGREAAADRLALRLVILGGEELDPAALASWFERHGDEKPELVNMYGITETTVHVTHRRLRAGEEAPARGSPIGRPIPDLEIRLLDSSGQPVPTGTPGEIYVGGAGVTRGYLKRPSLTEERFVAAPSGESSGARLYRSGDLALELPDGDLIYLGRSDDQVKIRGFRVEPGEIEACLRACPAVSEAAVVAREDGPGQTRLVAHIVPRVGAALEQPGILVAELKDLARRTLPAYMRPGSYAVSPSLPLTAHGKIDRGALAGQAASSLPPSGGSTRLRTATERAMASLWREVIGVEAATPEDDFFELGGDSLSAVHLFALVEDRFGIKLEVETLAGGASVALLAEAIDQRALQGAQTAEASPMGQVHPAGDSFPLTDEELASFERDGYAGPFTLYPADEMRSIWKTVRLQLFDRSRAVYSQDSAVSGVTNIANYDRHLDVDLLSRHVCRPEIAHRVASILGPNVLCWRTEFFPKYAGEEGTDWHQASTFANASGAPQLVWPEGSPFSGTLSVWTAFTPATERNGCLRFIPGTHTRMFYDESQGMDYRPNAIGRNLKGGVRRGFFGYDYRELQIDAGWRPDESRAVSMVLEPGQFIIFWSTLLHSSLPHLGESKEMRLGYVARYVPTQVRIYPDTSVIEEYGGSVGLEHYGAVLVCGRDDYGHTRIHSTNTRGGRFLKCEPQPAARRQEAAGHN